MIEKRVKWTIPTAGGSSVEVEQLTETGTTWIEDAFGTRVTIPPECVGLLVVVLLQAWVEVKKQ